MKKNNQVSSQEKATKFSKARSAKEAAIITGYSQSALAQLRMKGGGPRYHKMSPGRRGKIIYFDEDLFDWIQTKRVESTSEANK